MGKSRTCILCDIVYSSKQEMDEHMRSMLHHRELENLKGRDCGHECRTCGVTVPSLTEYADHISSPVHKQRVEAYERQSSKADRDEEYFDKEMIELIEKRKELIRQEEAALKKAKEEEEAMRKWQAMKEQWHGQRPWLHQQAAGGPWGWQYPSFPQSSRIGGVTNWQQPQPGPSPNYSNWNNRQNRSATWHAGGAPDLQRWESFNGRGGSLHSRGNYWGGREGAFRGGPSQPRMANKEDNRGNYERSNDFHLQRPNVFGNNMHLTDHHNSPSRNYPHQKTHNITERHNKDLHSQESSGGVVNHGKGKGSKSEKAYRWAPYPPAGLGEPSSQTDNQPSSEKVHSASLEHNKYRSLNASSQNLEGQSQTGLGSVVHGPSDLQHGNSKECKKQSSRPNKKSKKNKPSQASSSLPSPSHQTHSLKHSEKHVSTKQGLLTNVNRTSSQESENSKALKHSYSGCQTSQAASLDPEQEHLLSEKLFKPKKTMLHKQSSEEKYSLKDKDAELHIEEDQLVGISGLDKVNEQCRNKRKSEEYNRKGKEFLESNPTQQSLSTENTLQFGCSSDNINLSLQSLQVSTSTMDQEEEDERNEREKLVQDTMMQAMDEGLGSDSECNQINNTLSTTGCSLPPLNKLSLPSSLKRDLNRHISLKGKGGAHEPNLNIARRIRNLSGSRKSETEKDTSLKPTLRQLISSSASRRNVNWDQVYQEVHRKKQEQGKGLPRFGIEMVPNEPEGPSHMEEDIDVPLSEGFHWDSLVDFNSQIVPARKRSMSESSVVANTSAASSSLLKAAEPPSVRDSQNNSKLSYQSIYTPSEKDCEIQKDSQSLSQAKEQTEPIMELKPLQNLELLDEESSSISGTEQNDLQSGGKKRRAVGDVVSPEVTDLERKNKRQKIKPKKEQTQLDELLTVSLREEELNSSLQTVDNSLIQARAALQAAYLEVQRLLMVKQQVTTEISSLRAKRIEILQGLQGGFECPQTTRSSEENTNLPFSSTAKHAASNPPISPAVLLPSPVSSPAPVAVKQERLSPVTVFPTRQATDSPMAGPHSTTPEKSAATQMETDAAFSCNLNSIKEFECDQDGEGMSKPWLQLSPDQPSPRASQEQVLDPPSPPIPANNSPNPVSPKSTPPLDGQDTKAGKRVRKLKKKRVLRNAQGSKQPDISDSELDASQPVRPHRRVRQRRRPSASNSSSSTAEKKDKSMEVAEALDHPEAKEPALALDEKVTQGSDSSELEMVELPKAVPTEVVNLDSSEPDEVGAEDEASLSQAFKEPANERTEAQNLACNEVTSTSELDPGSAVVSCESIKNEDLIDSKESKASSGASSDPGDEEEPTEGSFEGHQEAVNSMLIHNGLLFTCSGDRTIRAFNLMTRKCVAVFEGHSSKVNSLVVSSGPGLPLRLYSGSSDQTIRCYNIKNQECVQQLSLPDRVLCLHNRWKVLYAGLANGSVVTFSLKNNKQLDVFECHGPRAVSCLATAQEGARRVLLVGSYDATISVRDAKSGLLLRTLKGHTKTVLCMKVVNDLVFSGSSDQSVHAHNIHTGKLVKIYKGHSHAVTVVSILGKVMITACLDKLVRVYELQPHERLQVYGGHSDMVLCMVIHKNMIYTGCYNGSVQAVRLNLIQNYRCWWHGCSLIFGVMEHLQQHLLNDHTSPTKQTLKCRWRNCDSSFPSHNGFKQVVHAHMQKHAELDSKLES
ncbi:zinc finger protein 106 [Trichomycterus rosablanca]|uniref:zinc finger protein 106 n=1 Tax=Trichomycterus rosablanca TaxID=2290929 RepID=UPI002F35CCBE